MYATPDTLDELIELDCPFTVTPIHNGEAYVTNSVGINYTPTCEHDDTHDMLIDGVQHANHGTWGALTGYTGQHAYSGPVMHASEYVGGRLARDILATPGDYVATIVEAPCTPDNPCFPDDPAHCEQYGCDAEPAGWTILRLKK